MAQRLGRAFDTGTELWLNLQQNRDLWDSEHGQGDWQNITPLYAPERRRCYKGDF